MGRKITKAPLGLHGAWLECAAKDKAEHDVKKNTLSTQESRPIREAARAKLIELASKEKGTLKDLVDDEVKTNDGREPLFLM